MAETEPRGQEAAPEGGFDAKKARKDFSDFQEEVLGAEGKPRKEKGQEIRLSGAISHLGRVNGENLSPNSLIVFTRIMEIRERCINNQMTEEDDELLATDLGEWVQPTESIENENRVDIENSGHFYDWVSGLISTIRMLREVDRGDK